MMETSVEYDSIDDYPQKVQEGIYTYLKDSAQAGQNMALEEVPEDRGTLRKSLAQFVPQERDGSIVWGIGGQPHAAPMEFGTDPYWAPIQPLIEWAERVAGDPGLGYYVQWKIAQEGIDAQPYLRPGAEIQEEWLKSHDVRDYIEDEL
jgi:hypothetical protein